MTTAIWWIRRDLRLHDNQALEQAMNHGNSVLPLFILDPALLESARVGQARVAFLVAALASLDGELRARGGRLILCRGNPARVLPHVVDRSGATGIFAEADISPTAGRRDRPLAEALPITWLSGRSGLPVDAVAKANGDPYVVFTPYSRGWKEQPQPRRSDLITPPDRIQVPDSVQGVAMPPSAGLPDQPAFPPSEREARARLQRFVGAPSGAADAPIYRYGEQRDRLDLDGTSRISPYLRFGLISARTAVVAAREAMEGAPSGPARESARRWLDELIWREFYGAILYHYPQVAGRSFRAEYDRIPWENDEAAFAAWCRGETGYPVVDAAMRQLNQTGWMHNRARMIAASFLVKDLLIDWRWGERYFMQRLLDGDPASNNGGWQWAAGTGTDAAPYFRIFNPVSQGEKHDPDGAFVRAYVPELRRLPPQFIHRPWTLTPEQQRRLGCRIGVDYPKPMVDHQWARQRVLEVFRQARQ